MKNLIKLDNKILKKVKHEFECFTNFNDEEKDDISNMLIQISELQTEIDNLGSYTNPGVHSRIVSLDSLLIILINKYKIGYTVHSEISKIKHELENTEIRN
ncbi:MAG: hypothetical protein HRU03_03460 [Nanoarchaeales archaeon]|nr:hypothetical protein [Nanoarchaeales archaeon]